MKSSQAAFVTHWPERRTSPKRRCSAGIGFLLKAICLSASGKNSLIARLGPEQGEHAMTDHTSKHSTSTGQANEELGIGRAGGVEDECGVEGLDSAGREIRRKSWRRSELAKDRQSDFEAMKRNRHDEHRQPHEVNVHHTFESVYGCSFLNILECATDAQPGF